MDEKIQELVELIAQSKRIVFFGGAGVSTESGVPDFRSKTGIYSAKEVFGHPPEALLSHAMLDENPDLFFRFYKSKMIALYAIANPAHKLLAKLESRGQLSAVITQNIDGLHQSAGSSNVVELHGSNWRQYCMACGKAHTLEYTLQPEHCRDGIVPLCEDCGGIVRPDVVLYGERLDTNMIDSVIHTLRAADMLIIGGTSLAVYPASGLVRQYRGDKLVIINRTKTPGESEARLVIHKDIGKVFAEVDKCLFTEGPQNEGAQPTD